MNPKLNRILLSQKIVRHICLFYDKYLYTKQIKFFTKIFNVIILLKMDYLNEAYIGKTYGIRYKALSQLLNNHCLGN